MIKYALRRVLLTIPTLFAIVTIVFLVVRVIPGDPAVAALGDYASKQAVDALREKMGLNDPLGVQYLRFLGDLVRGDLGKSMITGQPVREQVLYVLPYSLELAVFAVVVGMAFGIPLGVYTAVKRNAAVDHLGRVFSLTGLSVPAFYLGILMMLLFAIKLRVLPATGGGDLGDWEDNLRHLILPGVTLGLIMTASVTRLTRSAMLNVLNEDYIRTARSKGLAQRVVIFRHALRSALVPVLSVIGIWIIGVIGSSVTTEMVFVRPGLGKMLVGAILQRDYTTLQSIMVVYATMVAGVNLLTDITYGLADPRVRY
ncbi:MAG: ABC transporter permease subunit [Ardenticatenales bacterium]|nr:ABC transporter permease subunit [Ardenticatenales bacterium]